MKLEPKEGGEDDAQELMGRSPAGRLLVIDAEGTRLREDGFFVREDALRVTFVDGAAFVLLGSELDETAMRKVADRDPGTVNGPPFLLPPRIRRKMSLGIEVPVPTLTVRVPFSPKNQALAIKRAGFEKNICHSRRSAYF